MAWLINEGDTVIEKDGRHFGRVTGSRMETRLAPNGIFFQQVKLFRIEWESGFISELTIHEIEHAPTEEGTMT